MDRKQQTTSILAGIGLLIIAIGLLGVLSVPSDPMPGEEWQFNLFQLSCFTLSFVLGSAGMALLIAARNSYVGVPLRGVGQSVLLGLALIFAPGCIVAVTYPFTKSSALLIIALFVPFLAFVGGGYLLLALRSWRRGRISKFHRERTP